MYETVFVFLVLGGIGFPIPEELPLLLGGMSARTAELSLQWMFLVSFIGVLVGDQTMFCIGYLFGNKLLEAGKRSPLLPSVTEERVNEVREGLRKKRLLYLFLGRHIFFFRSVTFLVAGSLKIPYLEFIIADAFAALFSVTIFLGIGWLIGGRVSPDRLPEFVHYARLVIFGLVVIGCALAIYFSLRKKCKQPQESEKS